MPIESAIVVTAITIAFVGFALILRWAEHQTRHMHPR
jgi:multisubunit Na+/H+ antiporter MnhC subunit